jgi:hypothetical protein
VKAPHSDKDPKKEWRCFLSVDGWFGDRVASFWRRHSGAVFFFSLMSFWRERGEARIMGRNNPKCREPQMALPLEFM